MTKKLSAGTIFPILLVAIGLIFGIAATVAYFQFKPKLSPQPQASPIAQSTPADLSSGTSVKEDETANWVLLEDKIMRISLKHPEGWFEYPSSQANTVIQMANYDQNSAEGRGYSPTLDKGKFKIQVTREVSNNRTLDQYVDKILTMSPPEPPTVLLRKSQTINGYNAIKVELKGSFGTSGEIFVEKGNLIYAIIGALDYESNKKTFDQILSTFQFLN